MVPYLHVLAVWLALWVTFYGWGVLACRICRCDRGDAQSVLVNPWIGIAFVVGALQIWHFFAPVSTLACGVVFAAGILASIAVGFRPLRESCGGLFRHPQIVILGALLVLWLVNRSLNDQDYTDNGLYYLNAIRWISDYRIVPGLANLHDRLGFNNSNFLLHAMLEPLTGRGYSAHIVNGFVAALTVPIVLLGLRSVTRTSANERQICWFVLALAMVVSLSVFDRRVSSAHPDFPAALFISIAVWRLLAIATVPSEAEGVPLGWNLLAIAMVTTAAVTMKTTVIFFAALFGIPLLICLYRIARRRESSPVRNVAKLTGFMAACCAFLFVPWVLRGYVASGYPFFPSTVGGLSVDWRVDPAAASVTRANIYAWNRAIPADVELAYRPGFAWVPKWIVQVILLRAPVEVVIPAAMSFVCLIWLGFHWLRSPKSASEFNDPAVTTAMLLVIAYAGAMLMWFLTAPSPRMGNFILWGMAAILVGLVSRQIPAELMIRYRTLLVVALCGLFMLPMIDEALRVEIRYRKVPELPEYGHHFYEYFPFVLHSGSSGFPPLPQGNLEQRTTNSGLVVNVGKPNPADGKPTLVWDSPLPAARFFNPNLTLRHPGAMASGFRMDKSSDQPVNGKAL